MIKLRGLYEWELRDLEGNIIRSGEQWNTTTDVLIQSVAGMFLDGGNDNNIICLSSSTLPTGAELRQEKVAGATIAVTQYSEGLVPTYDYTLNTRYVAKQFGLPVSPLVIRIIGISSQTNYSNSGPGGVTSFTSFIELSTPVTQQTNQYFYVKYTNFFTFQAGANVPDNRFVSRMLTTYLLSFPGSSKLYGNALGLGTLYSGGTAKIELRVTPFLDATNVNNVARRLGYIGADGVGAFNPSSYRSGCMMGTEVVKSYTISQIPGPVGALAFCKSITSTDTYPYGRTYVVGLTYGVSPSGALPSISRVFTHPASRIAQIFSDPSYPPSSQGSITLTGTPTVSYPVVGRVNITKTGDASDIVDETFLPGAVDTGANTITVVQSFGLNDIVRFTNISGALPSPLSAGTDYYILSAGTVFSVSLSQSGSPIDLLDQGTGTHTIIRQNTGEFSLELEPWNLGALNSQNSFPVWQLAMAVDADNKALTTYPEESSSGAMSINQGEDEAFSDQ